MIVILIGAPGSGKGTQSKRLVARYGFTYLATGDIFRAEIAKKSPLGQKAEAYLKAGKLVPDPIVIEIVAGKVTPGGKYLFDGFPRTVDQARGLDDILRRAGSEVDLVVSLTLPNDAAVRRMTSRRICEKCGEVYNTITRAPRKDAVCDKCGGAVIQREDDSEPTAKKRLMVFEDQTQPLVAYYRGEQVLQEIDAAQSPEKVEAALAAAVEGLGAAR
jgi:adenylate kinase